ncbi:MAG: hypothetical protein U1E60_14690 [Reyranellaceae bacterium]
MSSEFDLSALKLAVLEQAAERIVRKGRARALENAKRGASLVHDRLAEDDDALEDRLWDFAR